MTLASLDLRHFAGTFIVPQAVFYFLQIVLARWTLDRSAERDYQRFLTFATGLRVAIVLNACWCGLELSWRDHLPEGTFLVLNALLLSALQAQPRQRDYWIGLAPAILTLLIIGLVRAQAQISVGLALCAFVLLTIPAAVSLRRRVLSSTRLRSELEARNLELAQAVAVAELAEDVASLGLWRLSIPNSDLVWSRGTFRINGVDPASGQPSVEQAIALFHPEDRDAVNAAVAAALEGEELVTFEHRITGAGGELRHVMVKSKRVADAAGATTLIGVIQDVTDWRHMVDALAAARSQAELAAERAEEGMRRSELAARIAGLGHWRASMVDGSSAWSEEMFRIYGLPCEAQLDHVALNRMIHPDDRARAVGVLEQVLATGEPAGSTDFRIIRGDGAIRHLRSGLVLEAAVDGTATALVGVTMDVTAQIIASNAVAESEERFRALAENASDVIVRSELDGRITYVSPAIEAVTGHRPEELIGRTALDIIVPEDQERARTQFQDAVRRREGAPWTVQYRVACKDGGVRWVQARPRLTLDDQGRPLEVADIVRDITETKRQAEVLEASEARYRLLAETATDVISRFSLGGRLKFITPACERVLGYSVDEMIGVRIESFVHPEDWPALHAIMSGYVAAGPSAEPITTTYRAKRKDGRWIWLEGMPRAVFDPETGAPLEMQDCVRDITARRELEAELIGAREEAEAATRAKGDFLANMSHELRTPLNSIVGFSGLIANAPELAPETRRRAGLVAGASRSLVEIVNDILDFSKFEAEGVALDPEPVDLEELLQGAVELVGEQARSKGLTLTVEGELGGPRVLVDPVRLRQVVLNLLGNAIKFTNAGSIVLSLSRDAREATKIAVRDTGVGIPSDRLAPIFNRFAQADDSTSRRFGGTGLGLTICRTLVEAMGGEIGVHSVEGAGSTFWFTLRAPVADSAPAFFEDCLEAKRSANGVRVLLADDNEVNRDLFRALTRECGFELVAVINGAEAVRAVAEQVFDIVFMDVQMPVMDGLEATRAIRAAGQADLPIVALTANVLHDQIARCLAAGMSDHLAKPYTARDVTACVARWTPASEPDARTLSENTLKSLSASIGPDAVQHFLGRLAEQLGEVAALLRLGVGADSGALAQGAHNVRGLAGTLGFERVAQSYAELERAIRDKVEASRTTALAAAAAGATTAALDEISLRRAAA